jgi:hypothetical protein
VVSTNFVVAWTPVLGRMSSRLADRERGAPAGTGLDVVLISRQSALSRARLVAHRAVRLADDVSSPTLATAIAYGNNCAFDNPGADGAFSRARLVACRAGRLGAGEQQKRGDSGEESVEHLHRFALDSLQSARMGVAATGLRAQVGWGRCAEGGGSQRRGQRRTALSRQTAGASGGDFTRW